MKFSQILSTSVALSALTFAASSFAVPTYVDVSGANNLQAELDAITFSGGSANASTSVAFLDVNADQSNPDEQFTITGSNASSSQLIFEFAGNASSNTFGIYDLNNTANKLEIYSGANAPGGFGTGAFALTIDNGSNEFISGFTGATATFSSSNFGYYLGTTAGTFYSESALNGGDDHMVTYQGGTGLWLDIAQDGSASEFVANEYILAFEDLAFNQPGADQDYNDFVVLVESVSIVPEPSIIALMGFGLVGMGVATRRKQKTA